MARLLLLIGTLVVAAVAGPTRAEEVATAPVLWQDVQHLLTATCVRCHGPARQENGLRLDHGAAILQGGDNGPAVIAGNARESLLIQVVRGTSDSASRMPPQGDPLQESQIALLERWIDGGARFPKGAVAVRRSTTHWSFQPIVQPPLPAIRFSAWPANGIDTFILARLDAEQLIPSAAAAPATLIRRAALDLLGLTPSPAEVDAFQTDRSPDAYERLIDRLLASPHYGERFGRHWLDLARYADSNGYTRDFGREIWSYRDWVIRAINRNQPFDAFTIEQIAGDMLPEANEEQLVATGFHRNTLINEEGGTDQEQFRIEAVVDRVNTTGAVWLGLTVGCARCHTHKYDPLTQDEYYQLFALLNNCEEPTIEVPTPRQRDKGELTRRDAIRKQIARLEAALQQQQAGLAAEQREWEAAVSPQERARLPGPVQVAFDMKFDERDDKSQLIVTEYFRKSDLAQWLFPVLRQIADLRAAEPKIPTTMILRERTVPRESFVHKRGDFLDRGRDVTGGVPAVLPELKISGDRPTRLDLARWLVASVNPLTPRVVMNRDWLKFFGRGLVETEDDFGLQGTPPTHPELLDWLAAEFVALGSRHARGVAPLEAWNMKRMHRMFVTSSTYRQSSIARPDLASRDPHNKLLARQERLRLDAEIVRDVVLCASGLLSVNLGGPSVFPPQPEGVFDFTQDPKPWIAAAGGQRYRRGMYTHFWRSSPYPMLLTFDAPSGNVTCTRRLRSNTPLQSLTLSNDESFFEAAAALARRVLDAEQQSDLRRVELAFRWCVARQPTSEECLALAEMVRRELSASADAPTAAWTRICRTLLNLDETITRE